MIPYARLTPGPGFAPYRALLYYAQRMVTAPLARRAVSTAIATSLKWRHGVMTDDSRSSASATALEGLERDGLARLAPLLTDDAVGQWADFFLSRPVMGPDGAPVGLAALPEETATADYPLTTVLACPGMLEALNSPVILEIAEGYLGCKPTLSSVGVRWSFPTTGAVKRIQEFHRDVDDWRFLKLFIYLTDVDEGAGPHHYVRSSHRSAFGLFARSYRPEELERRFGAGAVSIVTGPRGTTFVADTVGVHRGAPPTDRARLILQVQYSLLPIFAFAYAPVDSHAPAPHAYSNRLIVRSRAAST